MKTIARGLIFVMFTAAAVLLLAQPLGELAETGKLDEIRLVVDTIAAFALVFVGTEASERLKERWRERPGDKERDAELARTRDRERSRR